MTNRRPEVKMIFMVLVASVASACLLAAFFVMNYGASGAYTLQTVMIEPTVLSRFNYNDFNPKTGSSDRYVFDKITWKERGRPEKVIPLSLYAQVFALLKNDKSTKEPIPNPFQRDLNPTLAIKVRTESPSAWQDNAKPFQEIQFQENFYRVELHEEGQNHPSTVRFVYFEHPDITAIITRLLNP